MPKQTLRLSVFGELKACGNNCAPFLFFNSALTHLRIHISLVARFETADKTVSASRNASAMLSFLPHPLASLSREAGSFAAEGLTAVSSPLRPTVARRERIYPFRFVASTDAVNTTVRSQGFDIVFPLRSLRGRCRLRQMRCYYIRAVGATLFPYVPTSSVITGRDTAKNVFVECKIASKKNDQCSPLRL